MPFIVADLAKKTKAGVIQTSEDHADDISYTYRYELITPDLLASLSTLSTNADVREVSKQIALLVASWDVLEAEGGPVFPLDAARLSAEIPLVIQMRLLTQMMQDMQGEVLASQSLTTKLL